MARYRAGLKTMLFNPALRIAKPLPIIKVKLPKAIFLLMLPLLSSGQDIDLKNSILSKLENKSDTVYSYSYNCNNSSGKYSTSLILTFDKKWKLIEFIKTDKKIKKRKIKIPQDSINQLINLWHKESLWKLDKQSLLQNSTNLNDSTEISYILSGCEEKFEMLYQDNYTIIESLYPDKLQELIENESRTTFIKCRNKFIDLTK